MKFSCLALIATVQAGFPGCANVPFHATFMQKVYQAKCIWDIMPKNTDGLVDLKGAAFAIDAYKSVSRLSEQPKTSAEVLALCQQSSPSGNTWNEMQWFACYDAIKESEHAYSVGTDNQLTEIEKEWHHQPATLMALLV